MARKHINPHFVHFGTEPPRTSRGPRPRPRAAAEAAPDGQTGPDRRTRRTRKLLHEALLALVRVKNYDAITVQDILDRADVGRSTFYVHFRDKDQLLFSGLEHLSRLIAAGFAAELAPPHRSGARLVAFSRALFEHAHQYRPVLRALLGTSAEAVVRRTIDSTLAGAVRREIERQWPPRGRRKPAVSIDLLTMFLVSTFSSLLAWWLGSQTPVSPAEIDAAYRELVLPALAACFGIEV